MIVKKIVLPMFLLCLFLACALLQGCFVVDLIDPKNKDYTEALELFENEKYKEAAEKFAELGDYRGSGELKKASLYYYAGECFDRGDFDGAIAAYGSLGGYLNSPELKAAAENEKSYAEALEMFEKNWYDAAKEAFEALGGYRDSQDYVAWIYYLQANETLPSDPEAATRMFASLIGYSEGMDELIYGILYNRAVLYYRDAAYEKALPIFETTAGYEESEALAALCGKHIRYKKAVALFENGEAGAAYAEFSDLGDFIDSIPYVMYIEAGEAAKAEDWGKAAELFLGISGYFDSAKLYEHCIYLYYDAQFQAGNRDLSSLPLLPLTDTESDDAWRKMRLASIKAAMAAAEEEPVPATGFGIYIDDSLNLYYVKDLVERMTAELPVFFLADCPEKVRYTVSFPGSSKYYGTYDDGTAGYETTITVTIRDNVSGESLFSRSYTAYPPNEVYYPESSKSDVYAVFDFFGEPGGKSAYESEILPALRELYE